MDEAVGAYDPEGRLNPRPDKTEIKDSPSRKSSYHVATSQLTTLNLANNDFVAVPVGLPCLSPKLAKLNLAKNRIGQGDSSVSGLE